ncbi:hypothetical protein I4I73_30540 [Pseudonocardia sp. KRD-184]|uniref:Uncharacterized protein n=1 Tax=Pseudonocardia oceani TaxID=2792013 RepID=A0ABS6U8L7_9PSEU|nr:hypothetical protein [Pseudonocardia oceani]MBW0093355.1 hypothetical protein [Pseudonocardia oceani]MBW0100322.1 hypothetical protein [Pseudonocardia oceani]MBW0113075.1 hypothetical protein [Pseudonocardia oceani]MBW0125888.1 hypothetical protein [Pseudonocardia oceani]MBW0128323.1 hypothetical protein [Pseudonocardia oceani]
MSRPASPPDTSTVEITAEKKAPDLTVNKVLAGAGAAATAAVLGSYLGAAGTVLGAALGSVASTIASVLYQRSLDRTRDTVVARIKPGRIPAQRGAPDAETVIIAPVSPTPARRPPWRRAVVAAIVVFVLGLAAVTGLEWVNGSSLTSNESGTSVGRVIAPQPAQDATDTTGDATTTEEPAEDSTDEPAPTPDATDEQGDEDRSDGAPPVVDDSGDGGDSEPTTAAPTTTPAPTGSARPSGR